MRDNCVLTALILLISRHITPTCGGDISLRMNYGGRNVRFRVEAHAVVNLIEFPVDF